MPIKISGPIIETHMAYFITDDTTPKDPQGTPFTHQNGLQKTKISQPFHEEEQVQLYSKEIQYLGHILSATGIRLLPSKTHAIQHM